MKVEQTHYGLQIGSWHFSQRFYTERLYNLATHQFEHTYKRTIMVDEVYSICPLCNARIIILTFWPDGSVTDCSGHLIDPTLTSVCYDCIRDRKIFVE
jgi:hypothetical protein